MNKVFCSLPFNSMMIFQDSSITPCCNYNPTKKIFFDEYLNSEDLVETRQKFLNNEWPIQCNKCKQAELQTGHSFRLLNHKFASEEKEIRDNVEKYTNNIKKLDLNTGNICNLKCLMCYGGSYVRMVELKNIGIFKNDPPRLSMNQDTVDKALMSDTLESVTLIGGEPFYDKVALGVIDKLINSGKSKNISLFVNTNLISITRPLAQKLKNNFKLVHIKASIDGCGTVNDYIRYPSKWSDICDAVVLIKEFNLNVSLTTALSNLSLLRYYELIDWAIKNNIHDIFISTVHSPSELACYYLPNELKSELLIKYLDLKNKLPDRGTFHHVVDSCIYICQQTENDNVERFKKTTIAYLKKHDEHRGNNCFDVFPELRKYAD